MRYGLKESLLAEIISLAEKHGIVRLILFGSRIRGDYHERSDIDLAATGGHIDRFALDVDEKTSTLLSYDIVNLDRPVQPELLENIQKEGRIIYAKG